MAASPGTVSPPRRLWHAIKYWRAARVGDRDQLDRALASAPAYIIVEGTEALRAYAASLANRSGVEAAWLRSAAAEVTPPTYVAVPTLGRIRDGHRRRPLQAGRRRGWRTLKPGLGAVLAACVGLLAALTVEWLVWPSAGLQLVRRRHLAPGDLTAGLPTQAPLPLPPSTAQLLGQLAVPVLAALAAAALLVLLVLAIGPGRQRRVGWRVDYRVQGLLVIARIRTQVG